MKKNDAAANILKLSLAALLLAVMNVVVWVLSAKGAIPAIGHIPLWGAFVALNIISLTWAIAMLGLRPMVVTISYVAGGGVAYYAVQGASGIPMAEAISAGAVYGAFGALTVGNLTTKVRLAFFSKPQIPFAFIVVILLVLDGMLNSQIFHADLVTLLKALVAPFVLAGGIIGVAEMMILSSKHSTGRIHDEIPVIVDHTEKKKMSMISDSGASFRKLNFRQPQQKKEAPQKAAPAPPSVAPTIARSARPAPQPTKAKPQAAKPQAAEPAPPISFGDDIPISIPFSPQEAKKEDKHDSKRQVTPEELLGNRSASPRQVTPEELLGNKPVAPAQPKEESEESADDKKKKGGGGHLDLLNNIR